MPLYFKQTFSFKVIFIYLGAMGGPCTMINIWKSEENLRELVFSFHLVTPWNQTQLSALEARSLPAKPSRWPSDPFLTQKRVEHGNV